jgi:Tc toxin complex TcA C-terminal TcB-binding domain
LDVPTLPHENAASNYLIQAALLHAGAALAESAAAGFYFYAEQYGPGLSATGSVVSLVATAISTMSSYYSMLASLERRKQDWEFQRDLANQDIKIGDQQVRLAEDHTRVVAQERQIAGLQSEHAQAVVEFLITKFTSVELYDWMSGVLEGVQLFPVAGDLCSQAGRKPACLRTARDTACLYSIGLLASTQRRHEQRFRWTQPRPARPDWLGAPTSGPDLA